MKKFSLSVVAFLTIFSPVLFSLLGLWFVYDLHIQRVIGSIGSGHAFLPTHPSFIQSIISHLILWIPETSMSQARAELLVGAIGYFILPLGVISLIWYIFTKKQILFPTLKLTWGFIMPLFVSKDSPGANIKKNDIPEYYAFAITNHVNSGDIRGVLITYMQFLDNYSRKSLTPKEHIMILIPRGIKTLFEEDYYPILKNITGSESCISTEYSLEYRLGEYLSFHVNTNGNGVKELKEAIYARKDDFIRKLPEYDNGNSPYTLQIKDTGSTLKIELINTKEYWIDKTLDFSNVTMEEDNLVLGYAPDIREGELSYEDYFIPSHELIHVSISGESGSGKGYAGRNIIAFIIARIIKQKDCELHLYDTKGNDFGFVSAGIGHHGLYRHTKKDDFARELLLLEDIMQKNIAKIGNYENFREYNKSLGVDDIKNQIKETFIVIEEFSALAMSFSENDDKKEFIAVLVRILSQSRLTGLHVILVSQAFHRSSEKSLGDILIHIKDRLILRTSDEESVKIVAKGLGVDGLNSIRSLKNHVVLHVREGRILKKYKPYIIEKPLLQKYVNDHLTPRMTFSNSKLNKYYEKVLRTGEIGSREAQGTYGLSQSEWEEFRSTLETQELLKQNTNNSLAFLGEIND